MLTTWNRGRGLDQCVVGANLRVYSRISDHCRGLAHDEETYPQPFEFNPERFINEDGALREDDCSFVFGFGRR